MPAGQRHVLLRHLGRLDHGERGLLANARCLAEGVDVPTLDGVAFIDPRRSEVDIVQAVGRAIRLAADKTVGTIVIPVFIDTDEDPEIALDDSAFKPVWDVIKALRSHDDELGEQLDELRRQLAGRARRPRLPGKIHLDLPVKGRHRFRPRFRCAPRRADHRLLGVLVRATGTVCRTTTVTPASRVPTRSMATGSVSGSISQRAAHTKGSLDADRQRRLEELPGWTWDTRADQWEEGFRRLLDYVERHGDARVPASYKVDGYQLGKWVIEATRRSATKAGLTPIANADSRSCPAGHGTPAPTSGRRASADSWTTSNATVTPASRVPTRSTATSSAGGSARNATATPGGSLEADREHRLQGLPGWTWDRHADQWEEGFSRLQHYVERHGDARVPYVLHASMATSSVCGSASNASITPKAPSMPTADVGSKSCPAGHGMPAPTSGRRASADSCTLRRTPR